MQLRHAYTLDATENVEHYRLNDREMLLTPLWVQLTWPTYNGPMQITHLPPEVAVAFARKIVAFYDEEGLGGEDVSTSRLDELQEFSRGMEEARRAQMAEQRSANA